MHMYGDHGLRGLRVDGLLVVGGAGGAGAAGGAGVGVAVCV